MIDERSPQTLESSKSVISTPRNPVHTSLREIPIPINNLEVPEIPVEEKQYLESIRQWIFTHTGLHYSQKKQFVLYKRLQTLCWRLGISGLEEMDKQLKLKTSSQLGMEIICTVSTNHTFFFREPEVLDQIQKWILPQLPADEAWRIWSAAASSGEEAYTLAILLAETFGLEHAQKKAFILGTDINHLVVEQAEHGVFIENHMELVTPQIRKRYFHPVGLGQWRVIQDLKQMCTFRQMNLQTDAWPFNNSFHVILCRNILYYFDLPHQEQLVERLYNVTMPGGWLVTSVTETMHGLRTRWHRIDAGVFRKD